MRRFRGILLFFFLGAAACSNPFPGVSSTTQTLTNQGLITYTELVLALRSAFLGVENCADFQTVLDTLPGLRPCMEHGSETLSLIDSSCQELPEFLGQASMIFAYEDCGENGVILQNDLSLQWQWDGLTFSAQLSAAGIVVNGLPQSFKDLSIVVGPGDDPQCQGVLISRGQACGVTSDCNFCPF